MIYNKFEDLPIFQETKKLILEIYKILPEFGHDYELAKQLKRAVVSVLLNIAEGFERKSNKEFANFINISKGSAGEVRAILLLAHELSYLTDDEYNGLTENILSLSKQLSKFNKYLVNTYKKNLES